MTSTWKEVVARRGLILVLVRGELDIFRASHTLGWLWWFLDPLILALVYSAVFGLLFLGGNPPHAPYALFLLCGLTSWKHVSSALQRATSILRVHTSLLRSMAMPSVIIPISATLATFVYFLASAATLALLTLAWPRPPESQFNPLALLQLPILLVLHLLIITALAIAVAPFGVLLRDTPMSMQYALRMLFFLTPILYGMEQLDAALLARFPDGTAAAMHVLYLMNPLASLIHTFREVLFAGRLLSLAEWLIVAGQAVIFPILGWRIYRSYDERILRFL